MVPAARQHAARRRRRPGRAPQNTTPTPANTARSATAYAQKNTACVPAHTCAAVSCPASAAHRGRQRAAARRGDPRAGQPGRPRLHHASPAPSASGRSAPPSRPAASRTPPAAPPGTPAHRSRPPADAAGSAADPSPATSSVVPAGSRAVTAASAASAARTAPPRAPPGRPGSDPRSTTVSGHRASTARLSPEIPGRYEPTAPPGPASASAAPGPTAVAQPPGPAADASSPHRGPYFSVRLYTSQRRHRRHPRRTRHTHRPATRHPDPVTTGTAGHKPPPARGTCARSPPFSVSHASAGHVRGPTAKSTSDPDRARPRHRPQRRRRRRRHISSSAARKSPQ